MTTREMKVYSGRGTSKDTKYPWISMQGMWLWKAGFSIGDKILVTGENGRLVIEKKDKLSLDLKVLAAKETAEHRKEAV